MSTLKISKEYVNINLRNNVTHNVFLHLRILCLVSLLSTTFLLFYAFLGNETQRNHFFNFYIVLLILFSLIEIFFNIAGRFLLSESALKLYVRLIFFLYKLMAIIFSSHFMRYFWLFLIVLVPLVGGGMVIVSLNSSTYEFDTILKSIIIIPCLFGVMFGVIGKFGLAEVRKKIAINSSALTLPQSVIISLSPVSFLLTFLLFSESFLGIGSAGIGIGLGAFLRIAFEKTVGSKIIKNRGFYTNILTLRKNLPEIKEKYPHSYKIHEYLLCGEASKALRYIEVKRNVISKKDISEKDEIAYRGFIYYMLRDWKKLDALYEKYHDGNITRLTCIYSYYLYRESSDFERVKELIFKQISYNKKVGKREGNYYLHHILSLMFFVQNDIPNAIKHVNKAMKFMEDSKSNNYRYVTTEVHAVLLEYVKKTESIEDRQIFKKHLSDEDSKKLWGRIYDISCHTDELYNEIKKFFPKYSDLKYKSDSLGITSTLGFLMALSNNYSSAELMLSNCFATDGYYAKTLLYYGYIFLHKKKYAASYFCYSLVSILSSKGQNKRYELLSEYYLKRSKEELYKRILAWLTGFAEKHDISDNPPLTKLKES